MFNLRCMAFGLVILILAGCKSQSVNLEEAKSITAEFHQNSFIAPPRSANDVIGKLLEPKISPTENLALNCDGQARDSKWVKRFKEYLTRYDHNDRIDTSKDPVGGWKFTRGWELYRGISISELNRGNLAHAERYQKQYLKAIPFERKGTFVSAYSHLALIQIARGDLVNAARSISSAESNNSNLRVSYPINDSWLANAKGAYAMAKGDYKLAEKHFRYALKQIKISRYAPYSPNISLTQSRLAEAIAAQGRLVEAEYEVRQAIEHTIEYNHIGNILVAPVYSRYAKILLDQGRIQDAEQIARATIWIFQHRCTPGDSIEFAESRRKLAEILAQQDRFPEAMKIYSAIKASLGENTSKYKNRYNHDLTLSYTLIALNELSQARKRLSASVDYFQKHYGQRHHMLAEAKGFLAIAEWDNNNVKARKLFQESLNNLTNPDTAIKGNARNLQLIINEYLEKMAQEALSNPDVSGSLFSLVEANRNSVVQESIMSMGTRASVKNLELASLIRDEQNARKKINALELTLNNAIAEGGDYKNITNNLQRLRQAQATLFDEIMQQFPDYANLINPDKITITEIQNLLKDNESYISIYSGINQTYIWVINKDSPIHFTFTPHGKRHMTKAVDQLRRAFTAQGETIGDIPEYDTTLAYQLYKKLLAPSADYWQDKEALLISAYGPLGHLPLSVLPTRKVEIADNNSVLFMQYRNVPYLIKTHAITNIPSASSFKVLRSIKKQEKALQTLVGFADPVFNQKQLQQAEAVKSYSLRGMMKFRASAETASLANADINLLPRLPETASEVQNIINILGVQETSDLFLRKDANEKKVKEIALDNYQIIIFATHGLVPGELNGLNQPALALSAPDVSNINGDGLLSMDEIMNLTIDADWVVLSACNTGSSDGADAEAVSGLGRAFFYAGARSLLVSNWPVETQSASKLTTGLFKRYQTNFHPAKALQKSMVHLIEKEVYQDKQSSKVMFSYAHPIFWAPFSLVGAQ
jgi:CHAT domain-containing protein